MIGSLWLAKLLTSATEGRILFFILSVLAFLLMLAVPWGGTYIKKNTFPENLSLYLIS